LIKKEVFMGFYEEMSESQKRLYDDLKNSPANFEATVHKAYDYSSDINVYNRILQKSRGRYSEAWMYMEGDMGEHEKL